MKKIVKYLILTVLFLIAAGIYYYITLPAINIHSSGFWFFMIGAVAVVMALYILRSAGKQSVNWTRAGQINTKLFSSMPVKLMLLLIAVLFVIYIIGSVLSSPIINAGKYQKLMKVDERSFTEDITEVDYNTIPILDKDSSALLANRKMGSLVDMVSQFEVGTDYTQINYKGVPVRVTPLVYASGIKWLTNQSKGIPAYMMINMANQDTECVILDKPIKYSKSEHLNRNLYRHLRFNFPTYLFDDQIFFEIDDNGTPYWICPVKKYNIGLFGGQTIERVVLCNAQTGEFINYEVGDVPKWIDKVYSAELLVQLYDYAGTLKHGYFNSVLGQKDCLQTTSGYNYIALDDDVWVYTGVTSVSKDQSNVGFVLMNQRTMETRYYKVEGATEESAMSSAEGLVQHLGYVSTFPLLINVSGESTYFMALKDNAGLVKKYAMVNVEKYQLVATGDTPQDCAESYTSLLSSSGVTHEDATKFLTIQGTIVSISPIVLEGTTHYYVCLKENEEIFDFDMSDETLLSIVRYVPGDTLKLTYQKGINLNTVEVIEK